MKALEITALIQFVFETHANKSLTPKKAFRYWDMKTPYGVHPTWCAMTIMTEANLPEEVRFSGAQALLLHDILEDTTSALPSGTTQRVVDLVQGMTFESSDKEMIEVWNRDPEIRMLKIYDKVSNLLDSHWMSQEKRKKYCEYLMRLCDDVEPHYGELNIIKIARAIS